MKHATLTLRTLWCAAAISLGGMLWHTTHAQSIIGFETYKTQLKTSEGQLLDRHGKLIASQRLNPHYRRLDWVALPAVSPAFIRALLSAEDQRFYSHAGVDWTGVVGSLWNNLNQNKTRGASSISMQVAALLDTDLARARTGRSPVQKIQQMQAALVLETAWRKQDILEAYFNTIYFRSELQGIAAASWGLFQKAPSGLDTQESALLAALVRAPNAAPKLVAHRACQLIQRDAPTQPCDHASLQAKLLYANLKPQPIVNQAPHLAQQLLSPTTPTVRSSLDAVLQNATRTILQTQIASIAQQGGEDGAAIVLDNATGEVLAYIGSSGDYSQARWVDAARAPRQAGSTLKPFLYGLALEHNYLTAASVLDDSPLSINTRAGLYTPHNYDEQFIGDVSVRRALASSLNIPAVRAFTLLPPNRLHQWMQTAGFTSLAADADHYGPSLALGSADVTLLDLTNAYRSLANLGLYSATRFTPNPAPPRYRRIMAQDAAWIVGNILADNTARSHTFGFDSVLATPIWTAVKTGTSKDMRDNWCIGYSQHYTVGVWVGNAQGSAMHNVSGVGGAAPAWAHIMQYLHAVRTSQAPAAPKHLVQQTIHYSNALEPARAEWFIAGTQPTPTKGETAVISLSPQQKHEAKITWPLNGATMAWDPDIPANQQGIVLKHNGDTQQLSWRINNQPHAHALLLWARNGITGKTKVELINTKGHVLDTVYFELRRAALAQQ